jgi:hypothetical protein
MRIVLDSGAHIFQHYLVQHAPPLSFLLLLDSPVLRNLFIFMQLRLRVKILMPSGSGSFSYNTVYLTNFF